jgi:AmmeMemoRadiSam system protein A
MTSDTLFDPLANDDKELLLRMARKTIEARCAGSLLPSPTIENAVLRENRGAFVTLTIEGRLRGCIGHIVGVEELWRAVQSNAQAAAFEDPRFPALRRDELDLVQIEISVLTPLRRVSPADVVVGRDGLLVERGPSRGVLLPQVAIEYGWDRETFLDHACQKAGLARGSWREPETSVSVFSAEVFKED